MLKSFKYRLYPTEDQIVLLNEHLNSTRFIYNLALETKMNAYTSNKINLSRFDLSAQLVDLKNEAPWLKKVNSQSIQHTLIHLDNAYKKFFSGSGFPKFKKKSSKQSFHVPQSVKIENDRLHIPKFKQGIKMIIDRKHKGSIKSATISKTPTNKYYVSILCETSDPIPTKKLCNPNTTVGIDMGLKNLITLSTGEKIPNLRNMRNTKICHLQRLLSKMKKGSNRKRKRQQRLNKIYEKLYNQKNDLLNKISTEITNRFDTIVLEDLNVKGMLKNHKLAKSISESNWSELVRKLEYKCLWNGKNLVKIDRFYASSKICGHCGAKYKELKLSEREWTCGICGTKHDRDVNAALNIKNWLVEHQCQDVEKSSVDERSIDPKKHLVCETSKFLDYDLETTTSLVSW